MTEQPFKKKRQEKSSVESELNKLQHKTAKIGVQHVFFAEGATNISILGKRFIWILAYTTPQNYYPP